MKNKTEMSAKIDLSQSYFAWCSKMQPRGGLGSVQGQPALGAVNEAFRGHD
jgi:hypothetical protein